jgi:hypothetical protein
VRDDAEQREEAMNHGSGERGLRRPRLDRGARM